MRRAGCLPHAPPSTDRPSCRCPEGPRRFGPCLAYQLAEEGKEKRRAPPAFGHPERPPSRRVAAGPASDGEVVDAGLGIGPAGHNASAAQDEGCRNLGLLSPNVDDDEDGLDPTDPPTGLVAQGESKP